MMVLGAGVGGTIMCRDGGGDVARTRSSGDGGGVPLCSSALNFPKGVAEGGKTRGGESKKVRDTFFTSCKLYFLYIFLLNNCSEIYLNASILGYEVVNKFPHLGVLQLALFHTSLVEKLFELSKIIQVEAFIRIPANVRQMFEVKWRPNVCLSQLSVFVFTALYTA